MKQEDKELLLKDICARLPYGVKVEYKNEIFDVEHVSSMYEEVKLDTYETWTVDVSDVKPYLFPLSSITEEQRDAFRNVGGVMSYNPQTNKWAISAFAPEAYDWLNTHHFDYRGLIPRGLAIDATGLNIY